MRDSVNVNFAEDFALEQRLVRQCGYAVVAESCNFRSRLWLSTGKNGKLKQALQHCDISVLELPLVETKSGPDRYGKCSIGYKLVLVLPYSCEWQSRGACRDQLAAHLKDQSFDWVVITSPEAANVFLQGWTEAERPQVASPRLPHSLL